MTNANSGSVAPPIFSTATSLLFVVSLVSISMGLIALLGFVGQCAVELPYHLAGKDATATVGERGVRENTANTIPLRSALVWVYYFPEEAGGHIVSARLRGIERLAQDNLTMGGQIQIVYLPDNLEEVMPKEILLKAREEITQGIFGGLGIALPGIGIMIWLWKTGQFK